MKELFIEIIIFKTKMKLYNLKKKKKNMILKGENK